MMRPALHSKKDKYSIQTGKWDQRERRSPNVNSNASGSECQIGMSWASSGDASGLRPNAAATGRDCSQCSLLCPQWSQFNLINFRSLPATFFVFSINF